MVEGAATAIALGTITGKSTTREFTFTVESETKVFEYLKVYHRVFGDVLCQVTEISTTRDESIAHCEIIGYKDAEGAIKSIPIPTRGKKHSNILTTARVLASEMGV